MLSVNYRLKKIDNMKYYHHRLFSFNVKDLNIFFIQWEWELILLTESKNKALEKWLDLTLIDEIS